jgi:hypothetical protein
VKKARTTSCTRDFSKSFTLWPGHVPEKQGERVSPKKKCPAEKNKNRAGAGATPLFGLSAAQKVFGVAPALGTSFGAPFFVAGPKEF